jgi:hypothetical protein
MFLPQMLNACRLPTADNAVVRGVQNLGLRAPVRACAESL